jgi:pimeloyl-ACP methyl ester carboxylesterase
MSRSVMQAEVPSPVTRNSGSRSPRRAGLAALMIASALVLSCAAGGMSLIDGSGLSTAFAQDAETPAPVDEVVSAKDGWPISLTYYKSKLGKEAPVVVLLHEKGGNRFVWQTPGGVAESLQKLDFAVVTVDLRKHGQSVAGGGSVPSNANQDAKNKKKKETGKKPAKNDGGDIKPADMAAMVAGDMEAVKKFLFEKHQAEELNMAKMALIAPEMGGSVAAQFAVNDWFKEPHPDGIGAAATPRGQDVRAIALLSPQTNTPGLPLSKPLGELKSPAFNIAFLVAVGKQDPNDKGQAKKAFEQLSSVPKHEERMYLQEFPGAFHGTQMLGKPNIGIERFLMAFLDKHLKKANIPWRDRRSKLAQ